jgi:isoquinoline 1-oxidoreductase alpha subunit
MPRIGKLHVNGKRLRIDADPGRSLLGVLRDDLGFTGSKYGCGEGQCGACTVLVDGVPRRSCITPLKAAAGKQVTTIEGLETNGTLHPLQEAFLQVGALQCGYCTPGMIMSAVGLLSKIPEPTDQEVIHFMEGNICRCCAYPRIIAAIRMAAMTIRRADR